MKTCSKCKIEKEDSEFYIRKKTGKTQSYCKKCTSDIYKKWCKDNPDKLSKKLKKWRDDNPDKVKVYIKKWKDNNKDVIREYNKKWRDDNPDKVKVHNKKWSDKNPDKVKVYKKKWSDNNPDKVKEYGKNYSSELNNYYVIKLLCNNNSLTKEDIPNELIEIKRLQIKIERELKQQSK